MWGLEDKPSIIELTLHSYSMKSGQDFWAKRKGQVGIYKQAISLKHTGRKQLMFRPRKQPLRKVIDW